MKSMGGVSNEITVHSLVCRTTLAAPLNPSTLHRVRTTNQYWPHYRLWNICLFCMAQQSTWISIDFSTNLLPLSHWISACMGQGVKGVALLYLIFRARILGTQYHEMSLRIWHLNTSNFISYPILTEATLKRRSFTIEQKTAHSIVRKLKMSHPTLLWNLHFKVFADLSILIIKGKLYHPFHQTNPWLDMLAKKPSKDLAEKLCFYILFQCSMGVWSILESTWWSIAQVCIKKVCRCFWEKSNLLSLSYLQSLRIVN